MTVSTSSPITNGLHTVNGHKTNGLNSGGAGHVTNGLHTAQLAMITNNSNGIHQQSINGVVFSRQSSVEKVKNDKNAAN